MPPADAPDPVARVRWRWRVEHWLVHGLIGLLRALPVPAAFAFARGLGALAHLVLRSRVRLARRQMADALGGRPDDARIRADVRACFRHFMRVPVEMMTMEAALARKRPDEVLRLRGKEHFDRVLARGRGVIFLTGHLGNWEVMGTLAPKLGLPVTGVGRPIENPLIDAELLALRSRFGQRMVEKDGAGVKLLRELRQGHTIALMTDQHAGSTGLRVPFFHAPASTFTFIASLARRLDVPLLPIFSRCGARPHEVDAVIEPPIEPDPSLPEDEDAFRMTLAFHRRLEAAIRAAPGQYLWFHKRWKASGREPDPKWLERYAARDEGAAESAARSASGEG
jgi:KDO2-lipid IV(A) lauroyltransferase